MRLPIEIFEGKEDALDTFIALFGMHDSVVRGAYEMAMIGEDLDDAAHRASDSAECYLYISREIHFT